MKRNLAILFVLLTGTTIGFAGDWYHWRGPWQTGVSAEKDLPDRFTPEGENVIWKAPYGCRSTPLVMNGRVFLINNTGKRITEQERVMCFDADTGKVLWEHKFNVFHSDIVSSRLGWTHPAGDPVTGNIYTHGAQGLFFCFNRDGKVLWSRSLAEEFGRISGYGGRVTSPTVDGDLVIIGMLNSSWGDQAKGGCRFVAMDKNDGKVIWWSEPGGPPKDTFYSSPVVAEINGQRLLISGGADGGVYAMKVRTGEPVWTYTFGTGAINVAPVVEGTRVYIGHGEESPDNNIQGRLICLDAGEVKNGQPKVVWQKDGLRARYASAAIHEGRLYQPDEAGKLFCLDTLTGKQFWRYTYGREARGAPVLADGKLYIAEVNSVFHILKPGDKKCESLHEQHFASREGVDVEINGSAAVANGRIYFATSEDLYCIGKKGAKAAPQPPLPKEPGPAADAKPAHLQIVPAEVTLYPGDSVKLEVRAYDANGRFLKNITEGEWSFPTPPLPPGAKAPPPALQADMTGMGAPATLHARKAPLRQQGYVSFKSGTLTAKARVRVAPQLPYVEDFEKVPDGAVPGGWVNGQGKFLVTTLKDGTKALRKVNDKASPLVARGNAYLGLPNLSDYTIQADVMGTLQGQDMPDLGIVANRYSLVLAGNIQKLRILSWDALPRIDKTMSYEWKPGVWYRMKLTTEMKGDKGIVRGKIWQRDQAEPTTWMLEITDPVPNREGSPALYGYVTGILEGQPGNDIFYDNVSVTPNKK